MATAKCSMSINGHSHTLDTSRRTRPRRHATPADDSGHARRVILSLCCTKYTTNTGRLTCVPHVIVSFTNSKDASSFTCRFFSRDARYIDDRVFATGSSPSDPTLCAKLRYTRGKLKSTQDASHYLPDPFLARFGKEFSVDDVLVVSARHLNTLTDNVQHFARDHYLIITFSANTTPHIVDELPPVAVAHGPFVVQLVKLCLWLNHDTDTAPIAIVLSRDHHRFGTKLQSFVDVPDNDVVLEHGPADHYFGYNPATETWVFRERKERALRAFIEKSGINFPPTTTLLL